MAKVGLSEAGEALRDYFGPQLNADRSDGPDRMVTALMERFHLSKGDAKKLVDDLIAADSVHFVPEGGEGSVVPQAPLAADRFGSEGVAPAAAGGLPSQGGYWRFK